VTGPHEGARPGPDRGRAARHPSFPALARRVDHDRTRERRRQLLRALVALAVFGAQHASAQTAAQIRRAEAEVGVEERLGARVPPGTRLEDDLGQPIALAALAGRPLLLSFNYTGCPRLCSVQLAGLARGLRDLGWSGQRFGVATVSIDPAETLPQLHRYKETYVGQAGGGEGVAAGWRFLHGSKSDVDALAAAVGFRYRYDPRTNEFAHQATVVVLTGDGRVSGYLHGVTYSAAALDTAVTRAEAGRVATVEEQRSLGGFLLTCIGFDPADPLPLALKIMRAGGVAIALSLATFLALQVRKGRSARTRTTP
jgi:protein SCO1/2